MKYVPTGIEGFDELVGGGLPEGRVIIVIGGPGTGKTLFGMQYLYYGATKFGEKGVFVSLDEPAEKLKNNMASFGFDIDKLQKEGKISILEVSPTQFVSIKPSGLIHLLKDAVKSFPDIKRIVLDPITSMVIQEKDIYHRRLEVVRLFSFLADTGCTAVVTSESRFSILRRRFNVEEFLSDGVIILHKFIIKGRVAHAVQVEKMRGVIHDTQLHPYRILKNKGITVYPKEYVIELQQ
ncbi:MAG: RAD55 family ATPase [Candidatus Bathyarchaeota archaeon]